MSKTALVTGGGRGIGAGIVEKLAADGWNVAFCGRKEESAFVERCRELGKRYGVKAVYFRCDVSARGDREMLLTLIRNTFGSLEALVNNAGVAPQVRADPARYERGELRPRARHQPQGPLLPDPAGRPLLRGERGSPGRS